MTGKHWCIPRDTSARDSITLSARIAIPHKLPLCHHYWDRYSRSSPPSSCVSGTPTARTTSRRINNSGLYPTSPLRIREATEKAKIELLSTSQTEIDLPFIIADARSPKHINTKLLRSQFEFHTNALIDRTNEVILVGGMTCMPRVADTVKTVSGRDPSKSVNHKTLAIGASRVLFLPVTSRISSSLTLLLSPSIDLPFIIADARSPKHINTKLLRSQFEFHTNALIDRTNEVILVGGMTCMPRVADTVKTVSGRDPSKSVNHKTLAIGASRVLFLPVTSRISSSLTLLLSPSVSRRLRYYNQADLAQHDHPHEEVPGERELVRDNELLGNFNLIEITFDIDADGIVNVSAKDKAMNKDQSMTIASSSGLSDEEFERVVSESEQYAEADKAESVCTDTEKAMNEFKDQLNATEKEKVTKLISELRELAATGQAGIARSLPEGALKLSMTIPSILTVASGLPRKYVARRDVSHTVSAKISNLGAVFNACNSHFFDMFSGGR
ncbi:hypothetical protein OF83DRAFT_1179993 [Amylostereum chailletii]|nr:hypothetical protein OF83DRAFT_1179993 [Amylostereum chailletii]